MLVGNSNKEQHCSNRSHVGMYIYIYAWIIYVNVYVYCIVLE